MPTPTYHNMGADNYGDWQAISVSGGDVTPVPAPTRGLWVGGAGAITLTSASGNAVTFAGVPAGTLLPFQVQTFNNSGTTATGIVALY